MNEFDTAYNKDLTNSFNYRLLSRLQSDCKYYLGQGNKCEKHLWAGNPAKQIEKMKELYNKLPEKPEWCTWEDICNYEKEMIPMPVETVIEEEFTNDDLALIVEHCEVVNESLGKWAKNVFTKFGKGSVENEFLKTFKEFRDTYKFKRYNDDKPNNYAKTEGNYIIIIKFKQENFKKAYVYLSLLTKKLKQVQDFKDIEIKFKHSNTVQDMANNLNKELKYVDLALTTKSGKLPPELTGDKPANKEKTDANNTNVQQKTEETFNKVADSAGFEPTTFKEKLGNVDGSKEKKINIIKSLITGWKKFSPEQRQLFEKLQK